MNWQVAIDIEAWKCLDETMLDILEYANNNNQKVSVLFSERLYGFMPSGKMWQTVKYISNIQQEPYDTESIERVITLSPDLVSGLQNDNEKEEVRGMTTLLWKNIEPLVKLYALNKSRNPENNAELSIMQDEREVRINLLTSEDLENYLHSKEPKLEQAKHIAQQERNIGGETASTFKAWDPRNDTYARELLKQAWDDATDNDVHPDELFVWDSQNETYVRFMHSGNGEYHGHDFAEFNRIPDEVKERYHHWKK